MNAEFDRLSILSDDLINKILSYIDTKHAIRTSILSSRWKDTWKSIQHLDLSSGDVTSSDLYSRDVTALAKLSESVISVMSSLNNEKELSYVKLSFPFNGEVSQAYVKTIMNCVYSHNVQKMTIICLDTRFPRSFGDNTPYEFPLSFFVSQSLKDLNLIGSTETHRMFHSIKITSTWDLLALTTLHLDHVEFNIENPGDLISKCPNLKNLTLTYCYMYVDNFIISHPQLSNLTLKKVRHPRVVNVVAPQLKNLTLVKFEGDLMISAPELSSLMCASKFYFKFSADGLSSLEKVDFYITHPFEENAPKIIDVFQQFCNVKYLTLGLEIVEVLASSVQLFSHLTSPFAKLTSFVIYPAKIPLGAKRPQLIYADVRYFDLYTEVQDYDLYTEVLNYLQNVSPPHAKLTRFKIYPANLHSEEESQTKINMPSEVKSYLLDGSPSATITIFSPEEVVELQNALLNAVFAPKVMAELQKLLEHEKLSCENIITHADKIKAPMDRHDAKLNVQGETQIDDEQKLVKEEISQIKKGWEDVSVQIEQGNEKINYIFSMLDEIESSLKVLPASRKDRIHASFISLRAEAYKVTKLILDCMKIKCEGKVSAFMNLL